jgi:hypothetical protein
MNYITDGIHSPKERLLIMYLCDTGGCVDVVGKKIKISRYAAPILLAIDLPIISNSFVCHHEKRFCRYVGMLDLKKSDYDRTEERRGK